MEKRKLTDMSEVIEDPVTVNMRVGMIEMHIRGYSLWRKLSSNSEILKKCLTSLKLKEKIIPNS